MSQLWRLTRNPRARRLYDRLDEAGLTLTLLREYRRPLSSLPEPETGGVRLRYHDPDALDDGFRDADVLDRADRVVAAYDDGLRVGSVLLTVGRPVYVDSLHRQFDPEGAYIWRLYVDPDSRDQGLGRLLVRASLWATRQTSSATDQACALVAPDNVPSQRVFEALGFQSQCEHRYVRAFGRERRSIRSLA